MVMKMGRACLAKTETDSEKVPYTAQCRVHSELGADQRLDLAVSFHLAVIALP